MRSSLDLSDPFIFPLKEIMDKVYDEHLKQLPDTLKESLEKAQQVKELMYDEQIKRIVEVQKGLEAKKEAREIELR